jgi:hypothetical protein
LHAPFESLLANTRKIKANRQKASLIEKKTANNLKFISFYRWIERYSFCIEVKELEIKSDVFRKKILVLRSFYKLNLIFQSRRKVVNQHSLAIMTSKRKLISTFLRKWVSAHNLLSVRLKNAGI